MARYYSKRNKKKVWRDSYGRNFFALPVGYQIEVVSIEHSNSEPYTGSIKIEANPDYKGEL